MKKINILFSIFLFGVCATGVYWITKKSSPPVLPDDILLVGTSDDYPPYTFNKNGEIVGFDIDLAREIAKRLGKTMRLKNMSFDILLLELQRGRLHVIAAGLSPTQERAVRVFFTTPHLQADPFLAVTRIDGPSITCVAELAKQHIVVNEGYTADFYLSARKDMTLDRVETVAQAILALSNHKADVFVVSKSAIQPFLKTRFQENFKTDTLQDLTENYALAVSKQYPELYKKIETVLEEIKEDGTLETLKRTWELS